MTNPKPAEPRPHEKWCASVPRGMDAPMGRGPYKCDCGAEGALAAQAPALAHSAFLDKTESAALSVGLADLAAGRVKSFAQVEQEAEVAKLENKP